MKKLISTIATVFVLMSPTMGVAGEWISCLSISNMAEEIMFARQHGISIDEQRMNIGVADNGIAEIAHAMVTEAYTIPREYTTTTKFDAITDFTTVWQNLCASTL
jgi:hypothetical protein